LGFFDSSGTIHKAADDPYKMLSSAACCEYLETADRWFLAGHTRYATTGKVTDRNAHPFQFGHIIGAHNGMVGHPWDRKYSVDSEYLFDQLSRHADYQAALADVSGYWGLSWTDGGGFFLQAHGNQIAIAQHFKSGAWYYSSDARHLCACIGWTVAGTFRELAKGQTVRFAADGTTADLPAFVSNVKAKPKWDWRQTAKQGGKRQQVLRTGLAFGPVQQPPKSDLGYGDYCALDELAVEAGYGSAEDFMLAEGITSESHALTFLEDSQDAFQDPNLVWEDYIAGDNYSEHRDLSY